MDSGNRVKEGKFSNVYMQRLSIVMCYQTYSSGVEHRLVFVVTSDISLLMGVLHTGRICALPACITNAKIPSFSDIYRCTVFL
jgi:hypothetical protein